MYDTVAIDGDILVYRAASVGQHTYYDVFCDEELIETFEYSKEAKGYVADESEFFFLDNSLYEIKPRQEIFDFEEAKESLNLQLKAIKKKVEAKKYKIYLTGKGNYREDLATVYKYKGNREDMEKPHWFYAVRDYIIDVHGAIVVDGNEADDACSVVAYRGWKENPENPTTVCVSADKDLRNTPGLHLNMDKQKEPDLVTLDEANRNFYTQLLCGDKSTDNIPGLEGLSKKTAEKYGLRKSKYMGPKGAEKLLEDCTTEKEMYDRCKEAYQDYYSEQEDWDDDKQVYHYFKWDGELTKKTIDELMYEQGNLLWMQREKGDRWGIPDGS